MNQDYRPTRFQVLPPVVKNILIISGILFLATQVFQANPGINLTDFLGLHYFSAELFKPYQFITYLFMHADFTHLFFNMFAVWTFGSVLENVWGPKRFLIFYLITGMGAALIQYLVIYLDINDSVLVFDQIMQENNIDKLTKFFNSVALTPFMNASTYDLFQGFVDQYNEASATDPTKAVFLAHEFIQQVQSTYLNTHVIVGASGSLFGLLLAFGMLFPNTYLSIFFFFPIKAKYFVMIYGLFELLSGIANQPGDNVAHFAHLGGMLFGFFMILYWKKNRNNFY